MNKPGDEPEDRAEEKAEGQPADQPADHGPQPPGGRPAGPPWAAPPPMPSSPPTVGLPPDRSRAALVGLLNLSGLGLGYAALRHWGSAALCWAASLGLLAVALPVGADGMPGVVAVLYGVFLLAVAADGVRRGLRTPLALRTPGPRLALPLAFLLLAVPVLGTAAHGAAQNEAVEEDLLKELAKADSLVEAGGDQDFGNARGDYRRALAVYADIGSNNSGSRAGREVPDRLENLYETVAAPYREGEFCAAVEPLRYLRAVPKSVDRSVLGELARWPDERLARSLYECGMERFAGGGTTSDSSAGQLGELLETFPDSPHARKVGPAVRSRVEAASEKVGGSAPCSAVTTLNRMRLTVNKLPEQAVSGLGGELDDAVKKGDYACGVDSFRKKNFSTAQLRLSRYADRHKGDPKAQTARKIAIAAEIAKRRPSAGRSLPSGKEPGGARMSLEITNDGPGAVEILYTGPVTGSLTVKGCKGCTVYPSRATARSTACRDSSRSYPRTTLRLPAGDYDFLYKRAKSDLSAGRARDHTSGSKIRPGYTYTSCLYVTRDSFLRNPYDPFERTD